MSRPLDPHEIGTALALLETALVLLVMAGLVWLYERMGGGGGPRRRP